MQGEKCCRKPQLTLCLLFPYSSEQITLEDIHLIGGPFLALKAVRDPNCLTTEFHSLAVFFGLWIPLISCELAGPPTGLKWPRANVKSGAHNIDRMRGVRGTPPVKILRFHML